MENGIAVFVFQMVNLVRKISAANLYRAGNINNGTITHNKITGCLFSGDNPQNKEIMFYPDDITEPFKANSFPAHKEKYAGQE